MPLPAIFAAAARASASIAGSAMAGEAAGGRAVAQLAGQVGQLDNAAHRATTWVAHLGETITGKLAHAMTMWIGWLESAARPIEQLVRVANPAQADAFGRAVRDAYGAVGRLLIPVMESFTGAARKVGDLMAGLEPVFQPAINAIAKLVDVVSTEFVKSMQENAPLFELFADILQGVAERTAVAVHVLAEFLRVINQFGALRFARILGFSGGSFDPNASAVGAAARQARFQQPKEIANDAIKNALQMGVGQQGKKPEDSLNSLDKTADQILKLLEGNIPKLSAKDIVGAGKEDSAVRQAVGIISPQVALQNFLLTRLRRNL